MSGVMAARAVVRSGPLGFPARGFFTNARGLVSGPALPAAPREAAPSAEEATAQPGSFLAREDRPVRHCLPTMYYRRGGLFHLNPPLDGRSALVFQQPLAKRSSSTTMRSPFLEEFRAGAFAAEEDAELDADQESELLLQEHAHSGTMVWSSPQVLFDRELNFTESFGEADPAEGSFRVGLHQYAIQSERLELPTDTLGVIYQCESVLRKRRLKIKKHQWRKAKKRLRRQTKK